MIKTLQVTSLLFIFILFLTNCKKEDNHQSVPTVPVSFAINPDGTEFINLNTVNGWEYITGGYRGIVVCRTSINEFSAFDRACPFDWEKSTARIFVDESGIIASCPSCFSKFILTDGSPFEGPSPYPLLQYQTNYDGNLLYIYN